MILEIPAKLLPEDDHLRHAVLRDYFCDKDADASLVDGGWRLRLEWPGGGERHVDQRLREGLLGWDGIGLAEMASARRRSGRVLTALYDTWTLLSWSEWAARTALGHDECLTILHIDDHRDLGSPRLAVADGGLEDLITGRRFDVGDPTSVLQACESGAVGMGSFLTPFLLAFPNCEVRQLGQSPKITGTIDYLISPGSAKDELLRPGAPRPTITLQPAPSAGTGAGRYRATNDLGQWLVDIPPGPVLLHVDMDYFNNRYDGDCDWPDRFPRHDPSLASVRAKIAEVIAALATVDVIGRIEDAVVAFSPGFFPAEMWQAAEVELRAGLSELYE